MGQYLAIGIATNYKVAKRETKKVSLENIIEKMVAEIGFNAMLYEIHETEYAYEWNLKADKIENDFVPFLEHFYHILGKFIRLDDAEEVIQKLKSDQPTSLKAFLKKGHFYNFQESYSSESYDLYFGEPNVWVKNHVEITSDFIMLASTGKIKMESTGGFFEFFESMISHYFKEYALAKTVRIYIAG